MIDPNTAILLLVFWLFLVGGAVGSFLNVVVYRLPLGLSLVHPPSHCPKCGKPIRWYDNVPMLGWIALRGRCRDCRNPISARYPIIEAITAAMFAAVAAVEMTQFDMPAFYILYPQHILLLCTLLCAGLIEFDGRRVPWRLFVPALMVGIIAAFAWPKMWPMQAWETMPAWFRVTIIILPLIAVLPMLGMMWWKPQIWLGALPFAIFCNYVCLDFRIAGASLGTTALGYFVIWPLGRFWPKLRILPSLVLWASTLAWVLIWMQLVASYPNRIK
jgi:hypothetical protein